MNSDRMTPIFIGGTGRSGTTVLRRTLGLSPRIISLPREFRVIVDPDGAINLARALSTSWSPYAADQAIFRFFQMLRRAESGNVPMEKIGRFLRARGISPPRPYSRLRFREYFGEEEFPKHRRALFDRIVREQSRSSWIGSPPLRVPANFHEAGPFAYEEIREILADFFDGLFQLRNRSGRATHWVEDTPTNVLHYHELGSLFTNMRFIHIYRDPRDVTISFRDHAWGGDSLDVIARRVANVMQRWLDIRSALPSESFLEMSLERLSKDPEQSLGKIFDDIGLPMDVEDIPIERRKARAARWKREMKSSEISLVEPILRPVLDAYGYGS
jgi:hypothetical protein